MSNTKKNLIYNFLYQLLILIIPLVISPYLSRVIGSKGIGIYSYTYSIVYYFMLLTLLGVNNYGNRSIAKIRDDKKNMSHTFWSIYFLQLIIGIIMLFIYILYILIFDNIYKTYAIIDSLFILSAIFDINWLFFGMEEFKKTITRNIIVKIGSLILIFLFVKNNNDIWKYTLIMSSMTLLSQIIMWPFLKNRISLSKVNFNDIKKHLKPNLILFIPVIAVSLYKIMDKIMLGSLAGVKEVGFYENSEKIINIPLTIITALGTVMLPKISNLIANGNNRKTKEYMSKSIRFVMFLSLAMCFGLIGIGYHFAPLFFGSEFQKSGILIILLSFTIPFISFANVIRTQYLIPMEEDKIYIKSVIFGAIINLIMNIIFIPIYKSIGACIGTITAEIIVMIYQSLSVRKYFPIGKYLVESIPFFIKSLIMLLIIFPFNLININNIIRLLVQIVLGLSIYGIMNYKYINSLLNIKTLLKRKKVK